jgi:hypothetical protein
MSVCFGLLWPGKMVSPLLQPRACSLRLSNYDDKNDELAWKTLATLSSFQTRRCFLDGALLCSVWRQMEPRGDER